MNKISEWTGTWDKKMGKEVAEAAEAELEFKEAEKNAVDLEAEGKRFRTEMKDSDFTYIDEDWAAFLKEKETWIRRHNSVANSILQKNSDERVTLRSMLREIEEARMQEM